MMASPSPPLQPSGSSRPNLAEDRENMQKSALCSLTLPCLIIQGGKKKTEATCNSATGLGSIEVKSIAQDRESREYRAILCAFPTYSCAVLCSREGSASSVKHRRVNRASEGTRKQMLVFVYENGGLPLDGGGVRSGAASLTN